VGRTLTLTTLGGGSANSLNDTGTVTASSPTSITFTPGTGLTNAIVSGDVFTFTANDQTLNDKLVLYLNEVGSGDSCTTATFNPGLLTLGTAVSLGTTPGVANGKTFAQLGLMGNSSGAVTEAAMTAGNFVNLIGNNTVDAIADTGATSATLTMGTSRYFCVGVHLPSTTTAGTLQTTTDNAAQYGANTYAVHFLAAQKSGRP
jgi:hypothetical protein